MKSNTVLKPLFVLPFLVAVCDAQVVYLQDATPDYWYWYAPSEVVAAEILAHAEVLRSVAAEHHANARVTRAKAVELEIKNSLDRASAYWEKKEIKRAHQLRKYISRIDRIKEGNSKRWEDIKYQLNINGPQAVVSGNTLNFLLNRMDGTILAYDFNRSSYQDDAELRSKLSLDPNVVSGLRFRQIRRDGGSFEFGAEVGEALDVTWWPYALRDKKFDDSRNGFVAARNRLSESIKSNGHMDQEQLQNVNNSMTRMWEEVRNHFTRDVMFGDYPVSYNRWRETDKFLKAFDCQIRRLEQTDDTSGFDGVLRFDPDVHGGDLISLLTFMVQNGLEFAPAKPGKEASYYATMRMMRDVYLLVESDDQGIQPQKTIEDTVSPGVLRIRS